MTMLRRKLKGILSWSNKRRQHTYLMRIKTELLWAHTFLMQPSCWVRFYWARLLSQCRLNCFISLLSQPLMWNSHLWFQIIKISFCPLCSSLPFLAQRGSAFGISPFLGSSFQDISTVLHGIFLTMYIKLQHLSIVLQTLPITLHFSC